MHVYNGPPTGNGICQVQWSRDRWHHVTTKSQGLNPKIFQAYVFIAVEDRWFIIDHQQENITSVIKQQIQMYKTKVYIHLLMATCNNWHIENSKKS